MRCPPSLTLKKLIIDRLNPPQGFIFQQIYADDQSRNEAVTAQDGDMVKVPKGYHLAGAPFGYDLFDLNVMAGPIRRRVFANDPDHHWMLKK